VNWCAAVLSAAVALAGDSNQGSEQNRSVEQVFGDSVEALGGKQVIEQIKTLCVSIDVDSQSDGPKKFTVDACWSRAGGRSLVTRAEGLIAEFCTDGKIAWNKGSHAFSLVSMERAERMINPAVLIMNTLEPTTAFANAKSIEEIGQRVFAGKQCRGVRYVRKDGREGTIYFDTESGLPMGSEMVERNGPPGAQTRMVFGTWEEHQGVKFFRRIDVTGPDGTGAVMKISKVEINSISDEVFAPPEEVRRLAQEAEQRPPMSRPSHATIRLEDMTPAQQADAQKMLEALRNDGDMAKMRAAIARVESMIDVIEDPSKRLPIEYALQEARKEIAKAGG
jgi:hypothetical protein